MNKPTIKNPSDVCYNCREELILDFYWIVISLEDENMQFLGEDFDNLSDDSLAKLNLKKIEFEICAKCAAAQ